MNKLLPILGYIILTTCQSCHLHQGIYSDYSQSSGFNPKEIDSTALVNLVTVCKVWGYVKYHHPAFVDNKRDIDFELFDLLSRTVECNEEIRNKFLTEWIMGLGDYNLKNVDSAFLKCPSTLNNYQTNLNWIADSLSLGKNLSEQLVKLRSADRSKGNYYVTYTQYKNVDHISLNPCFINEKPYTELFNPDYGYRLLAVFRFWNMVEYFFPCKYMTDKLWSEILPEYILRMHKISSDDYNETVWSLIAQINDSHADIKDIRIDLFGENRVPIQLAFAQGRLLVSAPDTLYKYTIKGSEFHVGDEIIAVGGKSIEYYMELVKNYIPCSNQGRVKDLTTDIILRTGKNTLIPIRYRRNGIIRDTLAAVEYDRKYYGRSHQTVTCKIIDNEIAYINPINYVAAERKRVELLLANYNSVIIDFRYGMSFDFNNDFDANLSYIGNNTSDNDSECPYLYTYPIIEWPGVFSSTSEPKRPEVSTYSPKTKIIILVGGWTQSSSETYIQYLQTRKDVVVIGTQTAGADGNISLISLPGGVQTCFSGLGWFYLDGTPIQRIGVKIDRVVEPTINDIIEGQDELLGEAIKMFKTQKTDKN